MTLEVWYHGAKSDSILADRFQIIENLRHRTDPGDLGLGVYFSLDPQMSMRYGPYLYRCVIQMDQVARIPNPYRLWAEPQRDFPSLLFRRLAFDREGGWHQEKVLGRGSRKIRRLRKKHGYDDAFKYPPGRMKTVHPSYHRTERFEVSQRIRDYFLKYGYTGIAMSAQNGELAVFDPKIIKDVQLVILSDQGFQTLSDYEGEDIPWRNPLSDRRRDYLKKEWSRHQAAPLPNAILESIGEADPTMTGEYSPWILRLWRQKIIRLPEDASKIHEELATFNEIKRYLPQEQRDINRIASYADLRKLLSQHGGLTSRRKAARLATKTGQKILGKEGPFTFIEVTTPEAAHELGQGSGWCVKDPRHSTPYLKDGPLYFIYKDTPVYRYRCRNEFADGSCGHEGVIDIDTAKSRYLEEMGEIECAGCQHPVQPVLEIEAMPYILAHAKSQQVMDVNDEPISENLEAKLLPLIRKYIPSLLCQRHPDKPAEKAGLPIRRCPARYCDNENTCDACINVCAAHECSDNICYKCEKKCHICEEYFCHKHAWECDQCDKEVCASHSSTWWSPKGVARHRCQDCMEKCDNCDEYYYEEGMVGYCDVCEKHLCENCGGTDICSCQKNVCQSDSLKCESCDEIVCTDCQMSCSKCEQIVCKSCINEETGICQQCE